MKFSIQQIITCIFLVFVVQVNAQMTNIGQMHIRQNTDVSVLQSLENKDTAMIVNNGILHLSKNFKNNGIVSFLNQNSAKTIFKGLEKQYINGEGLTEFFNLEITNRTPDFSITSNSIISIHGLTDLHDGVVEKQDNGKVIFQDDASHANLKDESYFDNKVYKQGNKAFVFPLGHNILGRYISRFTAISAPDLPTDVFSAEYIWRNSNTDYDHDKKESTITNINTEEYWVIQPELGNSNVAITLSWSDVTTASNLLFNPEEIVIVRWNGEQWINEKGTVNLNNNSVTTLPSGYGVFTLANVNAFEILNLPDSFSPNNDGVNDTFKIPGLAENFPNFNMQIYNRYGNIVYDYKNNGSGNPVWWNGKSQGRATVSSNQKIVPAATYWYIIDFNDGVTKPVQKWLYLNK